MPIKTWKNLALSIKHLSTDKISMKGFDHNYQKALGAITLPILFHWEYSIPRLSSMLSMSRHQIRPYLEDHGCTKNSVVPSTLHQCLKYVKDGQQYQVGGEIKPFGIHEIKHCDAKYYLNSGDSPDSDEAKIQPQRSTREMYRIGA